MMTRCLAMEFVTEEELQMPIPPIARIYVQTFAQPAGSSHRYLSSECITPEQWDWEINRLKAELEILRSEGRARFNAWAQMRELHTF